MLKKPREKGRRTELEVAKLLTHYGYDAVRTPFSGGLAHWKGDITSSSFPFFIECKNCETWKPLEWFHKANSEAVTVRKPAMVIMTRNREELYCMVKVQDLLDLLSDKTTENQLTYSKQKQLHR